MFRVEFLVQFISQIRFPTLPIISALQAKILNLEIFKDTKKI